MREDFTNEDLELFDIEIEEDEYNEDKAISNIKENSYMFNDKISDGVGEDKDEVIE